MDAREIIKARGSDFPLNMREDEKLLIEAKISKAVYWKPIAIFFIALLFLIIARNLFLFLAFVSLVSFAYFYLVKSSLFLLVTSQRVMFRSGLIKVDTIQLRLDRIESVEIQRTVMGQVLGYATVVITGTGNRFAFVPFVANAAQIRDVVDELLYNRDKQPQPAGEFDQ